LLQPRAIILRQGSPILPTLAAGHTTLAVPGVSGVRVEDTLAVPFCPLPFARHIGREIWRLAGAVPGVERVEVVAQEFMQTETINAELATN
jgi:hypothetical protein